MSLSELEAEMNEPLTSSPVTPYQQETDEHNNATSTSFVNRSNDEFHDNYILNPNTEQNFSTLDDDDEEPSLSLDELMYSAGSFHAITRPVSLTMILAALAAVYINNEETMAAEEAQFAESYQVWDLDSGSWSKNLLASVGNAFVMVLVIAAMTFGIVLLYKYRCMKVLIGYMVFSSASLLGVLGDYLGTLAIEIYRIPIDVISYNISIYNFAVVGVIAIFYQKGIPSYITQIYLVFTSVILAWHLSHFDEWTAWTLLVMLALYDLCAVLTPCGPLRALVNAMQEEGSPEMPGLLYEAHLPPGTKKPGSRQPSRSQTSHNDTEHRSVVSNDEDSDDEGRGEHDDDDDDNSKREQPTERIERSISSEQVNNTEQVRQSILDVQDESSSSPLTQGPRATIPLAIAKVYQLQVVHTYGTSSPRNRQRNWNSNESNINNSPLLTDSSEEFYSRNFSASQLCADVEVEFPRDGGRIEKDCSSGKRPKYLVYNGNNELRRILIVSPKGGVFEVTDDGDDNSSVFDEPSSIRLGLGDFIFYSVMVAKAAMYSFTTFAACMLVILSGLGGTLVLLSVYHSALPALPISIFLGVIFYLLTKVVIEPYIEVIMTSPVYV